jgi:glutamate-1-semialdehyde aminotransferase
MLRRGVDLMAGRSVIMSAAHTQEDVALTATAFYETLREMRDRRLLG